MGQPAGGGTDTASPLVIGSFTATGTSAVAVLYGTFNISLWGTFVGTVALERSFDGGTTWLPVTGQSWTAAYSGTSSEPEHQVLYRLNCSAFTSGTINYRLSQSSDLAFIGGLGR